MKRNNCKLLFFLVMISIINIILILKFGISSNVRYFALFLNILVIIFCKECDILPLIFYTRPNFALYDGCGFKYLFNITIIICAIKLIFLYKKTDKISKKSIFYLIILFLYNAFLTLINNIGLFYLLTYISLFFSYIILIIYSKEKNFDFKKIYLFYATGMIMGAVCGLFIPLSKYGIDIPQGYRFAGLMRDSNGYSLELLLLIISTSIYSKITNKNSLLWIVLFFVLGCLGISKMFIICVAFLVVYKIIFCEKRILFEKINLKNLVIVIVIGFGCIFLNKKLNFISIFENNYLNRFNSNDLTSGRNDITIYYLKLLFNNPILLMFGKGLEYYKIIGYGNWFGQAHNTWLELILAFGIIGTIVYFNLILEIINGSKQKIVFKKEFFATVIIFCFCLNSLPILAGDALAILILYVILIKNINISLEENNEKN